MFNESALEKMTILISDFGYSFNIEVIFIDIEGYIR